MKRGPKPWEPSSSQKKVILGMALEGHAVSVIARRIGVDPKLMLAAAKRMGLPVSRKGRRSGVTDVQILEMVGLYAEGVGTKEIALRYGVNDVTIARYLRHAGISIRPAGFQTGDGHHAWKGGRILTQGGYVMIQIQSDDPFYEMAQIKTTECRYALEHRLVMARHLGRVLSDHETVHHKDGDRQNNDLSNLQLRQGKHGKGVAMTCADCGSHNILAESLITH